MAIALTAVMTTSLTACEDENVPAYGTGIVSDTGVKHNLSPTPPVETEPEPDLRANAMIRAVDIGYSEEYGEYIFVHVFITNNTDEKKEAWRLASVSIDTDYGLQLSKIPQIYDDEHEDLNLMIKPGKQDFVIYKFKLPEWPAEQLYVKVSVWDDAIQDNVVVDHTELYLTEE